MDTIQVTADATSLRNRAAELIKAGRLGAARPLLAAAQALAPHSTEFALISARLAMSTGAWEQALRHLDAAIAEAPNDAALFKCRAETRQRIGDLQGAARDAAEAVINDPTDMHAKAILGITMLDVGRRIDGMSCLREAVSGAPQEAGYREALATALEASGDVEAALHTLLEGIGFCPDNAALRNASIVLCIRRRDFGQAVRIAEQACSAGVADAATFGMKGHALVSLGDHAAAGIAYQEALKLNPQDASVRHLVVAAALAPDAGRAPETYICSVFDSYAERFETHLILLQYGIPAAIRTVLLDHPKLAAGIPLDPVLDLGCGTGLVALAVGDLPVASLTGVDLSSKMLEQARAKRIYKELRQADILTDLATHEQSWPLILAADVLCYFGALEELLALVRRRLQPNGWFVFSVEQIQPNHDGAMPGNGQWAPQRQGRYAHSEHYVYEAACTAGFRVLRIDRPVVRKEAGADVPGLLFVIEPVRHDR